MIDNIQYNLPDHNYITNAPLHTTNSYLLVLLSRTVCSSVSVSTVSSTNTIQYHIITAMSEVDLRSYQSHLVKARDTITKDTGTDKGRFISFIS